MADALAVMKQFDLSNEPLPATSPRPGPWACYRGWKAARRRTEGPVLKKTRSGVTRYYVVTKHSGKRRSHGGYPTRREAERALTALRKSKDDNTYRPPVGETLDVFLADWMDRKAVTGDHRPRTSAFYRAVVAAYISPVCGHVKLTDLKSAHVQACVRAMSKGTRTTAAPASVHRRYRVLKAALADAVKTNRLAGSPCQGIDLPKITKATVDAPTPEQVATILGAAVPPYDVPLGHPCVDGATPWGKRWR